MELTIWWYLLLGGGGGGANVSPTFERLWQTCDLTPCVYGLGFRARLPGLLQPSVVVAGFSNPWYC